MSEVVILANELEPLTADEDKAASREQAATVGHTPQRLLVRSTANQTPSVCRDRASRRLVFMISLTTFYFFVELIWGTAIGSLALVADAMHMLSDLIGMVIGLYAQRLAKSPPSEVATFGWSRMEVIGGLVNGAFLTGVAFLILLESISRFFEKSVEESLKNGGNNLLIVGGVGLGVNLVGLIVLSSGHGHSHGSEGQEQEHGHGNLNVYGVLLHVAGDALGSVAVIISGIAIRFSNSDERVLADPICSSFIAMIICLSAVPLMKRCTFILLQHAPSDVKVPLLEEAIRSVPGVLV